MIKINDRVHALFILNEDKRNERIISDKGEVVSIRNGIVGVFTDNLSPRTWFTKIENVELI